MFVMIIKAVRKDKKLPDGMEGWEAGVPAGSNEGTRERSEIRSKEDPKDKDSSKLS